MDEDDVDEDHASVGYEGGVGSDCWMQRKQSFRMHKNSTMLGTHYFVSVTQRRVVNDSTMLRRIFFDGGKNFREMALIPC